MTQIEEWQKLSDRFSLIPLVGKVPIEPGWQKWCEEKRLFSPKDFAGKNAGIACGPASKLIVVDVDHEKLFRQICHTNGWSIPQTMLIRTGAGRYHLYFAYPMNGHKYGCTSYKTNVMGETVTVFDVRGCGGQVVGPYSIHPDTHKPYEIIRDIPCADAPQWLTDLVVEREQKRQQQTKPTSQWDGTVESLPISHEMKECILNGRNVGDRSEAIMGVCNALIWSGLSDSDIIHIFDSYAIGEKYREKKRAKDKWLQKHIDKARAYVTETFDMSSNIVHFPSFSASSAGSASAAGSLDSADISRPPKISATYQQNISRNLSLEIREWVEMCPGRFSVADLDKELDLRTRIDKNARAKTLEILCKNGTVERFGVIRGHYQVVDKECELINFINISKTRFDVVLPFNLHNLYMIQPKNVLVVAGDSDAGKTAFLLHTLYLTINNNIKNKNKMIVNYYSSEMEGAEWNNRLLRTGIELEWWAQNFTLYKRSENFHQVMNPDALTLIDFLEVHEDFYRVGGMIKAIFDRLNQGIAIISLQKNIGAELGLGGGRSLEKARLYITIRNDQERGTIAKIMKGKNYIGQSKRYHEMEFSIIDSWKLLPKGDWALPKSKGANNYGRR